MARWDIAVVGGGVLGTAVAYWLGAQYEGNIVLLEKEAHVAAHASGRNTGVIHRPFYLDPRQRRLFAKTANLSFPMWKHYATSRGLPWNEISTLKVATKDEEIRSLEKNMEYVKANGMDDSELKLLNPSAVTKIEPEVRCIAALLVKTDTVVDFRAFTEALREDATSFGVKFVMGFNVERVQNLKDGVHLHSNRHPEPITADFVINCGGGNATDIAHMFESGRDYADMHFRGEYWNVSERAAPLVGRNVYCVPRQGEFPFLDPHWIVRVDGRREIGPNAIPVPGSNVYKGLFKHYGKWIKELFNPPCANKINVFLNRDFVTLSAHEIWSSISKGEMLRRVQQFIPRLQSNDLTTPGTAGVRSVILDRQGRLSKEAIEIAGPRSYHVLGFNSPGATGAPAYAAYIVNKLGAHGDLDNLQKRTETQGPWDWDVVMNEMTA